MDMDGRWGLGREQAGEVSTRLDDERATGGGHGVMTESTKFGSSKSSVMVGEGSRKFEETIRIYSGEMASADLGHLALCGYIHLEICGCMESLQNSLGDPTGPQLNLHQWLQNPNEQCHSDYVEKSHRHMGNFCVEPAQRTDRSDRSDR